MAHYAVFKLLQIHMLSRMFCEDQLKQHKLRSECYLFYFNLNYVCA